MDDTTQDNSFPPPVLAAMQSMHASPDASGAVPTPEVLMAQAAQKQTQSSAADIAAQKKLLAGELAIGAKEGGMDAQRQADIAAHGSAPQLPGDYKPPIESKDAANQFHLLQIAAVLGGMLGKHHGMNAMTNLTAVMNAHTEGNIEKEKQARQDYEANFKAATERIKLFDQEINKINDKYRYDTAELDRQRRLVNLEFGVDEKIAEHMGNEAQSLTKMAEQMQSAHEKIVQNNQQFEERLAQQKQLHALTAAVAGNHAADKTEWIDMPDGTTRRLKPGETTLPAGAKFHKEDAASESKGKGYANKLREDKLKAKPKKGSDAEKAWDAAISSAEAQEGGGNAPTSKDPLGLGI
jgi:hypothetical protein